MSDKSNLSKDLLAEMKDNHSQLLSEIKQGS
jgi:hypothetical protein